MHISIKTIVLLVGIALVIAVPFFWNEHISIHEKINEDKVAAYFTTIGALATAASIYLIYRQVVIMSKQQRPDLFMENWQIFVAIETLLNGKVGVKLYENFQDSFAILMPAFAMTNYGTAIATAIKCNWLVNFKNGNRQFNISSTATHLDVGKSEPVIIPPYILMAIKELLEPNLLKSVIVDSSEVCHISLTIQFHDSDNAVYKKTYDCNFVAVISDEQTKYPINFRFNSIK